MSRLLRVCRSGHETRDVFLAHSDDRFSCGLQHGRLEPQRAGHAAPSWRSSHGRRWIAYLRHHQGRAQCWGNNFFGQLGIGISPDSPTAAQVVGLDSGVTSIAAGYAHSCAIVNGGVMCWGLNQYGELGSAVGYTSLTPVAVGGLASPVGIVAAGQYHNCAIVNGGALCWGANAYGQLGNGATADSTVPRPSPDSARA